MSSEVAGTDLKSLVNNTSDGGNNQQDDSGIVLHHCNTGYLMGALGLFLQFLLAVLAFTSLIVKRYCEPRYERRPWKIWFFDTSKQALGAAVIHFANVFLADIFQGDPCTWYIVSFLLDSTIGILVIYIGLKVATLIARAYKMETLYFGEYGSPPQCNAWVGQCGLYILVMIIEKILMTALIQFDFWDKVRELLMSVFKDPKLELVIVMFVVPLFGYVRELLMSVFKDPKLELVIVMFVVPLFVNAFIFWVVDNFLKKRSKNSKTIYVSDNDHSVKYNRQEDVARLYNRIERADDGDSDIILTDEDGDFRHRRSDGTERLIT